jgi:hypothetical protein
MAKGLLLKFREENTEFGVKRETLEILAKELGMTETMTVHFALSKLASERLPAYEQDDGALSHSYTDWLNDTAAIKLPKGKLIARKSLL